MVNLKLLLFVVVIFEIDEKRRFTSSFSFRSVLLLVVEDQQPPSNLEGGEGEN